MTGSVSTKSGPVDSATRSWADLARTRCGEVAFTAASTAPGELLEALRTELLRAISPGATFKTYRARAKSLLSSAGWASSSIPLLPAGD